MIVERTANQHVDAMDHAVNVAPISIAGSMDGRVQNARSGDARSAEKSRIVKSVIRQMTSLFLLDLLFIVMKINNKKPPNGVEPIPHSY